MYTRLLQLWKLAAKDLELEVVAPYIVPQTSGSRLKAPFMVKDFGASKGMLIFAKFEDLRDCMEELIEEGYGYSVLDEPGAKEVYSASDFIELLEDWGWGGDGGGKPSWLK